MGHRKKQRSFRCSFLLLRSDKLSVCPHVVVVFIRYGFGLPPCDKARKPVYENVLHCRVGVRTRLLLAEAVGFEPTCRLPDNRISSAGRYDLFDTLPYIKSIQVFTVYRRCRHSLRSANDIFNTLPLYGLIVIAKFA